MKRYFFWMLVASGLGFLKVVTLAQIMAAADLGMYLSIVGVATLSGMVLSFGQIEGTTKYYPRLWLHGARQRIVESVRVIIGKMGLRFAIAAAVALAVLIVFGLENPVLIVVAAAGLGLCTAYLALAASLLRAAENTQALQTFNLVRNGSAIALACTGGWLYGWEGALAGDCIAAMLSLAQASHSIRGLLRSALPGDSRAKTEQSVDVRKTGGGKIYVANLFSSSSALLDRGAVNLALGAAVAGSYGVVALIFQVGQLMVNIFVQRAGPRVIKVASGTGAQQGRIESVRRPIYGMALLSAGLVAAVLVARYLGLPPGFFEKYDIPTLAVLLAGGVCFMQIFALFEFHLIAHDRERDLLFASAFSNSLLAVLFGITALAQLDMEWFVMAVFVTRTIHVGLLWRSMNDRHRRRS